MDNPPADQPLPAASGGSPPAPQAQPIPAGSEPATQEVPASPQPQSPAPPPPPGEIIYGRPIKRLLAAVIDGLILGVANGIVGVIFGSLSGASRQLAGSDALVSQTGALAGSRLFLAIIQVVVNLTINLSYSVGFLTLRGATPGKMALGLVVVDTQLGKLTFSRALLRESIGKFISSVVLGIGYLVILWDKRRQGWHDQIANTLVIEKTTLPKVS